MITNNGKALMYVSDWHEDNSNDPTYILQRTNGTEAQIKRNTTAYDKKLGYSSLANNIKIIVGTGTTSPTSADYSLSNEITSPSLKVIASNSRNRNNCNSDYNVGIIMEASATLMNISTADTIIINEVGLITQDDTGASYLLMREVLSTPIQLAPNETTALTLGVNQVAFNGYGLNGNGVALCYINNFGNGKNNKGEVEYPKIVLEAEHFVCQSSKEVTVRRSYVNPQFEPNSYYRYTNYKNFIDSITIVPSYGDTEYDYYGWMVTVSESCKNKNTDISNYSSPVIFQATKTIRNISYDNWFNVTYLKLKSRDCIMETMDGGRVWKRSSNIITLATIQLPSEIKLGPGQSASFTMVVG